MSAISGRITWAEFAFGAIDACVRCVRTNAGKKLAGKARFARDSSKLIRKAACGTIFASGRASRRGIFARGTCAAKWSAGLVCKSTLAATAARDGAAIGVPPCLACITESSPLVVSDVTIGACFAHNRAIIVCEPADTTICARHSCLHARKTARNACVARRGTGEICLLSHCALDARQVGAGSVTEVTRDAICARRAIGVLPCGTGITVRASTAGHVAAWACRARRLRRNVGEFSGITISASLVRRDLPLAGFARIAFRGARCGGDMTSFARIARNGTVGCSATCYTQVARRCESSNQVRELPRGAGTAVVFAMRVVDGADRIAGGVVRWAERTTHACAIGLLKSGVTQCPRWERAKELLLCATENHLSAREVEFVRKLGEQASQFVVADVEVLEPGHVHDRGGQRAVERIVSQNKVSQPREPVEAHASRADVGRKLAAEVVVAEVECDQVRQPVAEVRQRAVKIVAIQFDPLQFGHV